MNRFVLASFVASHSLAACAPAHRSDPAIARSVVVEITDTPPSGAARTETIPVAVVEGRGWSALKVVKPEEELEVKARTDRMDGAPSLVRVELARSHDKKILKMKLEEATLWQDGKRTKLGHVDHPDGTTTDVSLVTP